MAYQPEAIRIADGLDQNVQIDPQTSEDEPGGYRSELDELMADAAAILRSQHARIAELEAENKPLRILASGGMELFERYSTFKAKCAELEAMLDAVGAGGVGQSIKPKVQADTAQEPEVRILTSAPDGWKLVPMEPTDAMMNAAFDTEQISMEWGVDPFLENTSEVYKAMLAAVPDAAPVVQAVDQQFNTWSHDDGDSWYDNPGDAEIIQSCLGRDAKVGDEYELWASIDAVTLRYRIVAQHGDDFEVECISQPQQKTAPQPPAAQQEPVAWRVHPFDYGVGSKGVYALTMLTEQVGMWERKGWKVEPLYAAPKPARQPLTDSQVKELVKKHSAEDLCRWSYGMGIKDAEAAHGITGSQQ